MCGVLDAEDNGLDLEVVESTLQEEGIQVRKAWNGREDPVHGPV